MEGGRALLGNEWRKNGKAGSEKGEKIADRVQIGL